MGREGGTVGLVPPMGALPRGAHSRWCAAPARSAPKCRQISKPTQFGHNEESTVSRDEAADARQLVAGGCELMFGPDVSEMYPPGFSTKITTGALAEGLWSPSRHGPSRRRHGRRQLLLQRAADIDCFGENGLQQLQRHKAHGPQIRTCPYASGRADGARGGRGSLVVSRNATSRPTSGSAR